MAEHPAETLRRAAARLREASQGATPLPWRVSYIDGMTPVIDGPADEPLVAEMCLIDVDARANADLIVLLRNAAPTLPVLLEALAERAERTFTGLPGNQWCHQCGGMLGVNCHCWDAVLAVARMILGEGDSNG